MVTVVITTCKREPEIVKRAINSVIAQTYKDWELLIVDDSPSEYIYRETIKDLVLSFSSINSEIYYYPNEINSGASYSRNKGIKYAKGKYIAFLDDDDEWLPEKLEKQVDALEKSSDNVALVYQPYYKIIQEKNETHVVQSPLKNGMLYESLLQNGNYIGGMSVPLIRTTCIKNVGGFDNCMHVAEDLDIWLRLAKQYEIISISEPLVRYYIHSGEQLTGNAIKAIAGIERLNEKNKDYLHNHKKTLWKRQLFLIKFYIQCGKRKEAVKLWISSVCLYPLGIRDNIKELIRIFFR